MLLRSRGNAAPQPSPERQALAAAIQERDEAQRALDAVESAAGSWESPAQQAVRRAREALDVAPEAIEKAKEDAATFLVDQASGGTMPAPITIAAAHAAAQLARDELAAAESAFETLQARIRPAQLVLDGKELKVQAAAAAVLRASPEVTVVLDEVERAVNALWQHGAVLQALWRVNGLDATKVVSGTNIENSRAITLYHRLLNFPSQWQGLPPVPAVGAWDAALKALHRDATAPLPSV
jgi:hypothetical protein